MYSLRIGGFAAWREVAEFALQGTWIRIQGFQDLQDFKSANGERSTANGLLFDLASVLNQISRISRFTG